MKKIGAFFLIGFIVVLLSSCCKSGCQCYNQFEDDVNFAINMDPSEGGYKYAYLDKVSIIRYYKTNFTQPIDTVKFEGIKKFSTSGAVIHLNDDLLFPGQFESYDYVIESKNDSALFKHKIKNLQIAGEMREEKCCTCYFNTKKSYTFDTLNVDITGMGNFYYFITKP